MPLNVSKHITDRENGSLGFIETLHKQQLNMHHC